jgi:hypothetical protein
VLPESMIAVLASSAVAVVGVVVPTTTQLLTRRLDRKHELLTRRAAGRAELQDQLWARREELYIGFFAWSVPLLNMLNLTTSPTLSKIDRPSELKAQVTQKTEDEEARLLAFGSDEAVALTRAFVAAVYRWSEMAASPDVTQASLRAQFNLSHRAFETASRQLRKEIVEHYQ